MARKNLCPWRKTTNSTLSTTNPMCTLLGLLHLPIWREGGKYPTNWRNFQKFRELLKKKELIVIQMAIFYVVLYIISWLGRFGGTCCLELQGSKNCTQVDTWIVQGTCLFCDLGRLWCLKRQCHVAALKRTINQRLRFEQSVPWQPESLELLFFFFSIILIQCHRR